MFLCILVTGIYLLVTVGPVGGVDPIINVDSYTSVLGSAIFIFEGMGLILPIYKLTQDKQNFDKIIIAVIVTGICLFSFFGLFTTAVWGD